MGKALAVALALMLTGCNPPGMTRAKVIAAVKECEAANLSPVLVRGGIQWETITEVQCVPKEPGR